MRVGAAGGGGGTGRAGTDGGLARYGRWIIGDLFGPSNGERRCEHREWLWNNDFGKNEFLSEPAHTDYTIYAQNGEVFKHVRNARNLNDDCAYSRVASFRLV